MFQTYYIDYVRAILRFLMRKIFIAVYFLQIYITIRITLVDLTRRLFALLFFERNFRYRNP